MPKAAPVSFEPRRTPVQARSAASVQAILQATVQVLVRDGKSKLTTTRIAERAGVSIGTLYQYFPNKRVLLQALLKEFLNDVAIAIETGCEAALGAPPSGMADAITSAFVEAKFRHIDAGVALYAVSDDIEGKRIARDMHTRATKAMTKLFQTAGGTTIREPALVAATILSAMTGVSRAMLEGGAKRGTRESMEKQLRVMVRAYLQASATEVKGD